MEEKEMKVVQSTLAEETKNAKKVKKETCRRLRKLNIQTVYRQRYDIFAMLAVAEGEELENGEDRYTIYYGCGDKMNIGTALEGVFNQELEYLIRAYDYAYQHVGRSFLNKRGIDCSILGDRKIIGSLYIVGNDNVGPDIYVVVVENKPKQEKR